MVIDPRDLFKRSAEVEPDPAPLGGTRAQLVQRLQVGLLGLGAMVMMVALADVVITRARDTEATSVSVPAPQTSSSEMAIPRDPLADAGVVPDIPEETQPEAASPRTADATSSPAR